jgi:cell division protease FtsH
VFLTADFLGLGLTWDLYTLSTILMMVFMGVIAYFIFRTFKLMPQTKPQEISAKSKTAVTWGDVAGVDETKDELREVVEFLSDPKRFKALGAKVPKGILLHGPPGTGKTLLAKAVAHESGANFFSQSASSFVEMFAGLGAARIRRLFREARENAPAIIFIDELDAVGTERGNDVSGERDQTLNQLLVEMDGFNSQDDVIVMAASNLLEKLDKALLRPGRFDRQVFVPPPDVNGRRQILQVHTSNKPLGQDVDLERVARHAAGLTGADLANLANEAAIVAGRSDRQFIAQADFEDAFERVVAGLQSRKVITAHEKRVVAWHEAGHALVSELLPSVDKVQKVSIVPRGKALGYTLNLPQEDRYLKSRQELIDYMKVLLAGRVSEQIAFGKVTTGASDDLSRVTAIARSMVHEYGMGTSIRAHQVPGDDFTISESLRQTRDEEVQEIAEEAYRGATELLTGHRDLLDQIAERLLAQEVIERDEIRAIMAEERTGIAAVEEIFALPAGTPAAALAAKPPEDPEAKHRSP